MACAEQNDGFDTAMIMICPTGLFQAKTVKEGRKKGREERRKEKRKGRKKKGKKKPREERMRKEGTREGRKGRKQRRKGQTDNSTEAPSDTRSEPKSVIAITGSKLDTSPSPPEEDNQLNMKLLLWKMNKRLL